MAPNAMALRIRHGSRDLKPHLRLFRQGQIPTFSTKARRVRAPPGGAVLNSSHQNRVFTEGPDPEEGVPDPGSAMRVHIPGLWPSSQTRSSDLAAEGTLKALPSMPRPELKTVCPSVRSTFAFCSSSCSHHSPPLPSRPPPPPGSLGVLAAQALMSTGAKQTAVATSMVTLEGDGHLSPVQGCPCCPWVPSPAPLFVPPFTSLGRGISQSLASLPEGTPAPP